MNGREIFDKYEKSDPEYSQTLYTARMVLADDDAFFKKLEEAEKAGKRLAVVESDLEFSEPSDVIIP
jgi:hypothetical protein